MNGWRRLGLHRCQRLAALGMGLLLAACGDGGGDGEGADVLRQVGVVSAAFVSVAVDVDQLVGGTFWDPVGGPTVVDVAPYDFSRPRLRNLTRALAPAYLRLGGSAADRTYYDLSASPPSAPPPPFGELLTRTQWNAANAFAVDLGLEIVFTVNAGRGPRDEAGAWTAANARELLEYTAQRRYPLRALEFGNEPNLFAVRAGVAGYTAQEFDRDLAAFLALRDEVVPDVPVFAPGTIYTRTLGEDVIAGIVFGPRATEILPRVGGRLDGVNYHYYAAVSTRCPGGPRVTIDTALEPAYLDGIDEPIAAVGSLRDAHAPGRPIWLSETGGQSCGGQTGVADRFANTFWYLNTLGRLARRGHEVVFRQTLSGSTYGLIDEVTLEPRPDYWAALLWRRLMGTRVLGVPILVAQPEVRVYAHCLRDGPAGAVAVLALNPSREAVAALSPADLGLRGPVELYVGSADELASPAFRLNGTVLAATEDGTPPALEPTEHGGGAVALPPATWAFIVARQARAKACGN